MVIAGKSLIPVKQIKGLRFSEISSSSWDTYSGRKTCSYLPKLKEP